ncbi:energy-coupling factor transporter transmembrane component T family protein [Desulfospira joergensenii]|uniref:energy-coupling factor transporter transmembrane component T family protein n=1 Tax=Desulfospira joergensenii TaxID=53329 RepID=UPI0003B5E456|nr:energy-coupling factor transporter transmembrane component T [Desulfospira joergensenii]
MTLFSFRPGSTLVHELDVRAKCVLVCLLSLAILNTGLSGNLICLFFLLVFIKKMGFKLIRILKQLSFFLIFLVLILLSRGLTFPGDPMFTFWGVTLTRQGMALGSLIALRFLSIMFLGLVFTATTRPMEIKAAAQWFLKPVPLIPEKKVAIMISLALRFLPLILNQAAEVSHAVNARCGNLRKNPVQRMIHLTWPLLKKNFKSAEDLTLAMEARCYCENRTDPEFHRSGKEGTAMLFALVFCAVLVFI